MGETAQGCKLGLALSGGGFRAALYHIGVLALTSVMTRLYLLMFNPLFNRYGTFEHLHELIEKEEKKTDKQSKRSKGFSLSK
ncbi:hypothetical protein [Ectobacillus funiculus]|uniref:Uncharacterized protein n=1 Tax=Ectobacillus funiculus TaxID=137993 RepID=A0ABV5WF10_9BACI